MQTPKEQEKTPKDERKEAKKNPKDNSLECEEIFGVGDFNFIVRDDKVNISLIGVSHEKISKAVKNIRFSSNSQFENIHMKITSDTEKALEGFQEKWLSNKETQKKELVKLIRSNDTDPETINKQFLFKIKKEQDTKSGQDRQSIWVDSKNGSSITDLYKAIDELFY